MTSCSTSYPAGTVLAGKRKTVTVRFVREAGGAPLNGVVATVTRTRTGDTTETIPPTTMTTTADVATVGFTVVFGDTEQAGPSIVTVDLDTPVGGDVDAVELRFDVEARVTP